MIKHFAEWFTLKKCLHAKTHKPPYVSEGDIWWASVGENIGHEINGKSALFSRPVIIFKKLSHDFYFVIPTTSKEKNGSWYVFFTHKGRNMNACLQQARAIDYRRITSKLGTLSRADQQKIRDGFTKLYL